MSDYNTSVRPIQFRTMRQIYSMIAASLSVQNEVDYSDVSKVPDKGDIPEEIEETHEAEGHLAHPSRDVSYIERRKERNRPSISCAERGLKAFYYIPDRQRHLVSEKSEPSGVAPEQS